MPLCDPKHSTSLLRMPTRLYRERNVRLSLSFEDFFDKADSMMETRIVNISTLDFMWELISYKFPISPISAQLNECEYIQVGPAIL